MRPNRSNPSRPTRLLVLAALALATILSGACAADSGTAQTDPVLAKGEQIHRGRCAACHGVNGQGGSGRKLNNGAVLKARPTVADHIAVVRDGIPSSAMAPWKDVLSAEDIEAVVRYQREVIAQIPG